MQINQASLLVNGSFKAAISPLDRGFTYGDGVFRTIKVAKGLPEHWPMHYQTLFADCAAIGIVCPSADVFIADFKKIFDADEFYAVVKIIVTRGDGERGYNPPAITRPMRVMLKSSMPDYPATNFSEGVALHLCETTVTQQPKLAGIKHLNRLDNVLARMEWNDPNIAEGLMLDSDGNVIECTAANVLARYGDTLMTPLLNQCGVAGITRKYILAHAKQFNLTTTIESMDLNQLLSADEVIICNSLYGAWQVRSLATKAWKKQTLAQQLRQALNT